MTEPAARGTFDAYHKWLGISPKDQPPHYYRLLGVDLFESNADVISAAADKQMTFVRSFQMGKNSQLSQKILNEIAQARVCLLNPAKKASYDEMLRARVKAAASGIQRAQPSLVVAKAFPEEEAIILAVPEPFAPLPAQGHAQIPPAKTSSKKAILLALAMLGGLLVPCAVAIVVVMSRPPRTQVSQAINDRAGSPPAGAASTSTKPTLPNSASQASAKASGAAPSNSAQATASNDRGDATTKKETPPSAAVVKTPSGDIAGGKPAAEPPGEGQPKSAAGSAAAAQNDKVPADKVTAEKVMTAEELDKHLADAQTLEDYQAVAGEALRAAAKAVEDHQPDAARRLILKSLLAARKSGNAQAITRATRAVLKPESVKEILAEPEKPKEEPRVASRPPRVPAPPAEEPRASGEGRTEPPPEDSIHPGPITAGTRLIGLKGSDRIGCLMGSVRVGTVISIRYDSGTWTDPVTQQTIHPDDAGQDIYRVAVTGKYAGKTSLTTLPPGQGSRILNWRPNRDFDSVVIRCQIIGEHPRLDGTVYVRVTVTLPEQ